MKDNDTYRSVTSYIICQVIWRRMYGTMQCVGKELGRRLAYPGPLPGTCPLQLFTSFKQREKEEESLLSRISFVNQTLEWCHYDDSIYKSRFNFKTRWKL